MVLTLLDMEIRQAQKQQLIEVLYIIRECSNQLVEKGVNFWSNSHADMEEISSDIEQGYVYVMVNNHVSIATVTLKPHATNQKVMTISRLAVFPAFQRKGLASMLISFGIDLAQKGNFTAMEGYSPLYDSNLAALLEKRGFERKGTLSPPSEKIGSIIFEKLL